MLAYMGETASKFYFKQSAKPPKHFFMIWKVIYTVSQKKVAHYI